MANRLFEGDWVEVVGGKNAGWVGVISRVTAETYMVIEMGGRWHRRVVMHNASQVEPPPDVDGRELRNRIRAQEEAQERERQRVKVRRSAPLPRTGSLVEEEEVGFLGALPGLGGGRTQVAPKGEGDPETAGPATAAVASSGEDDDPAFVAAASSSDDDLVEVVMPPRKKPRMKKVPVASKAPPAKVPPPAKGRPVPDGDRKRPAEPVARMVAAMGEVSHGDVMHPGAPGMPAARYVRRGSVREETWRYDANQQVEVSLVEVFRGLGALIMRLGRFRRTHVGVEEVRREVECWIEEYLGL